MIRVLFVNSGIEPFSGSNQPQNTPSTDNRQGMELSPYAGQNNQNPQIACNEQTDDPYGIFEPVVQQTNFQGILSSTFQVLHP